ncbi:MAG TPA: class I SAM-dependent methyltransferase [Rhizomicrobium sp.]|nr:class I SAM-dependent methyltransferase [Rhizomicrobium sp.]
MNLSAPIAMNCPVCQGPTDIVFHGIYDDRYGYPDLFDLYKCRSCGHRHTPAQFSPEELGQLYTRYYPRGAFDIDSFKAEEERHGLSAWFQGEHASAFRRVPRNVRILDIGCGVGQTLAYHRNRGCEAYGIEADENVQAIAARHGLNIRKGIFDGSQFESGFFDYVTLDQVAEHVLDPHALMQGVARVLKSGGKAIITTPNPNSFGAWLYGRRWLNWHTPYHMQFYTRRSIRAVAARAGLKLVKTETATASEWQYYQWRHVSLFPRQGQRSSFWSSGQAPEAEHGYARILIGLGRRLGLQRWISRALDLARLGDNHVFILQKP